MTGGGGGEARGSAPTAGDGLKLGGEYEAPRLGGGGDEPVAGGLGDWARAAGALGGAWGGYDWSREDDGAAGDGANGGAADGGAADGGAPAEALAGTLLTACAGGEFDE